MKFLFFLLVSFSFGCTDATVSKSKRQVSATSCVIPDSLFALRNISNSLETMHFIYDENDMAYTDSSKRVRLVRMNADHKRKYLGSIPPYDIDWLINDWSIHFISRQDNIGSLSPIVVSAGGTDFSALILVLLDSECRPVSHFILSGGECGEDPSYCATRQSFIYGRKIRSYVRSIVGPENWYESDSLEVDSVNYMTEILENGAFKTRTVDSFRYNRISFIR